MQTFDPKDLLVKVSDKDGKTYPIGGFAETFVSISRPDPMWNTQVGSDGGVCRVKTNNTMADVSITLLQCSPSNDVFSAIATADEVKGSQGVFTLDISYPNSTNVNKTLLRSLDAFIEKKPDGTWGNSPQEREWVIKCGTSDYNLGVTSNNNHFYSDATGSFVEATTEANNEPNP